MSDLSFYSNFIDPIILGLISQDNFSLLDSLALYEDDYIESFLIYFFEQKDKSFLTETRFLDRIIKPKNNTRYGNKDNDQYDSLETNLLNQNYPISNPYVFHTRIKDINFEIPLYEEKPEKITIPFICNKHLKEANNQIKPMSYIGNINLLNSNSVFSKKKKKAFLIQAFEDLINYNSFCFYKKIHFFIFTNSNKEKGILTSCLSLEKILTVPFLDKIYELKKEYKEKYTGGRSDRRWYGSSFNNDNIVSAIYGGVNTQAFSNSSQPFRDFDKKISEFLQLNKELSAEAKFRKSKSEFAELYAELPYLITRADSDAWIYKHNLSEKLWENEIDFNDLINEFF